MKWVRIKKFANESGYSEDAIRAKIKKGIWQKGKHWRKAPDQRIFVNIKEIESWVEGKA